MSKYREDDIRYNGNGYYDDTAFKAIQNVDRQLAHRERCPGKEGRCATRNRRMGEVGEEA